MFRNYLISALRNLMRNRFYSGISIAALAMGLSAALLAALVIRNQLSYDHFIRDYQRTYLAGAVLLPSDRAPLYDATAPSFVAAHVKLHCSRRATEGAEHRFFFGKCAPGRIRTADHLVRRSVFQVPHLP
jgi:hypothetical protein